MMPVEFKQSKQTLTSSTHRLPVAFLNSKIVSFWKFNKEELEEIQKSGGIYVIGSPAMFPFQVQVEDPWFAPEPFFVAEGTDATVSFVDDEELFFARIDQDLKGTFFVAHKINQTEFWQLYVKLEGMEGLHPTPYAFGEEVKAKGFSSDFNGMYDEHIKSLGRDPANTLILERINKTKKSYE